MKPDQYVIAVSGGVDSVALLDALVNQRLSELVASPQSSVLSPQSELIVAHFDHGIRETSATDEKFVRGVVGEYGLTYETARAELGAKTSENTARQARYNFLRELCKKYKAQLITAHHQDDVLETMVLNLLRGTGWRGLVSLNSGQIIRPLLGTPKSNLLAYAQKYQLPWREDSTNQDQDYLRNYVRLSLLPRLYEQNPTSRQQLIDIHEELTYVKKDIATELQNKYMPLPASRYFYIMAPPLVARELLYLHLTRLDPGWHPLSLPIDRLLQFIKTAKAHKQFEASRHVKAVVDSRHVQFKKI